MGTDYIDRNAAARILGSYCTGSPWAKLAGRRLQTLRRTSGVAHADFLNLTGYSRASLSRTESGDRIPPFGEMVLIAHLLNVEVHNIWSVPTWPEVAQNAYPRVAG